MFNLNLNLLAALPSFCGPTYPKPSQLSLGQVIVEAMSCDAAIHHSLLVKLYMPWKHGYKFQFGGTINTKFLKNSFLGDTNNTAKVVLV